MDNPHKNVNIDDMCQNYIRDITSFIKKHAPIIRRQLTNRKHKTWYHKDTLKLKIQKRKAEKAWHKSQLESDKNHYLHVDKCYRRHLHHSKKISLREQ